MSPARTPAPSSRTPEPVDWNQVKTLFEALRQEIGVIAESQGDLRSDVSAVKTEFVSVTRALGELDDKLGVLAPLASVVGALAPVPSQLNEVLRRLNQLDSDVKEIKNRLTPLETPLAP